MTYILHGLWRDGLYRIEGPTFVVGFVVKDNVIVKAAPMVWKLGSHWINKAQWVSHWLEEG